MNSIDTSLSKENLPTHIAIVMDGNGRWAQARGLERLKGHYEGAEALKRTIQAAIDFKIKYLTVFAFSTENWHRPQEEVSGLMLLLRQQLENGLSEIIEKNIKLRIIGFRDRIDSNLYELINSIVDKTKHNTGLNLSIAFNYGSRAEIVDAARQLALKVTTGELNLSNITEEIFADYLLTKGMPDPDLLIRTSGDHRLSNYLLWQMAYTEMMFIEKPWPDFRKEDLLDAILKYQQRERRYGKISA